MHGNTHIHKHNTVVKFCQEIIISVNSPSLPFVFPRQPATDQPCAGLHQSPGRQ